MKTYLVTGGAGFIGSNFIHYMFRTYGDDVFILNLDKLTYAGNLENLRGLEDCPHYRFIHGDIGDSQLVRSLFTDYTIDYVVNFAAESHVDRSISDPGIFARTNVLGTLNLLDCARHAWQNSGDCYRAGVKFLQVSTDEVYGSLGPEGFFTEMTPLSPHSPYSASKASADLFCKAYFDTFKFPINITRCSNNYGPYQFPEKLVPLMIHNAVNLQPLPVYGDGLQIRDWLYVDDHCRAIDLVLQGGRLGEVYNVGGHNERTNIFIVRRIIDHLCRHHGMAASEALIKHIEDRKGHDRRYGIDPQKIHDELGWMPSVYFDQGIETTIDWYLEHTEWISNVTSGAYREYYQKAYGEKL